MSDRTSNQEIVEALGAFEGGSFQGTWHRRISQWLSHIATDVENADDRDEVMLTLWWWENGELHQRSLEFRQRVLRAGL